VHPASGYSVAASLRHAPRIAEAVAAALDGRVARGADEVAREVVAPPAARAVHALRHRGLDTLLRMPPAEVPVFFDRFFALPSEHRRAYLSAHDDVGRSLAAMWALFGMLPRRMRGHLVAGSVLGAGDGAPSDRSPRALTDHTV
jgi:lycopene beta-cyclase